MPRRVVLTPAGIRSQVVTDTHCRAGYMYTRQHGKVWCSCGWKTELDEATYAKVETAIREHKQAASR